MSNGNRMGRVGTVLWSVGLGVIVVFCGVSVLLPSTKRARIHLPRDTEQPPAAATTEAATEPTPRLDLVRPATTRSTRTSK